MVARHHFGAQWMARWTQAGSSSTTQWHVNSSFSEEINTGGIRGKNCEPDHSVKTHDPALDVPHLPAVGSEMEMLKVVLDNKCTVNSDSAHFFPLHNPHGSSIDWKKYCNSDKCIYDLNSFPMFSVNQKIDNTFAQMREHGNGTPATGNTESSLLTTRSKAGTHVMKFATEEQWTRSFESMKGTGIQGKDHTGLDAYAISTGERFELHDPYFRCSICNKNAHGLYKLGMTYKQQSPYSTCIATLRRDCRQVTSGSPRTALPTLVDGSSQFLANSYRSDIPFQSITAGQSTEQEGKKSLRGIDGYEYGRYVPHRMPKCPFHDHELPEGNRSPDSTNEASLTLYTPPDSLFKQIEKCSSNVDKMATKFEVSCESAPFKLFAVPNRLQSHCNGDRKSKVQRTSSNTRMTDGASLKEAQEASAKAGTMYIDVSQWSGSPAGVNASISTDLQEVEVQSPRKAASLYARGNPGKKLVDGTKSNPVSSIGEVMPNIELHSSTTRSMDIDRVISPVERSGNSDPTSPLIGSTSDPEAKKMWIKRLRHCISENSSIGTKRLKTGVVSNDEGALPPLSMASHLYARESSANLLSCMQEQQTSDKLTSLTRDMAEVSDKSEMITSTWLQRLSCKNKQATEQQPAAKVICEPDSSKVTTENWEAKQFPSIGAMALMGKVVNNFRPRAFLRKGSSLVWNTGVPEDIHPGEDMLNISDTHNGILLVSNDQKLLASLQECLDSKDVV